MKKLILAIAIIFTFGAFNSNAQNVKIAYVDYLEVIDSLPSKLAADKQIEAFLMEGRKIIEEMQLQLEADAIALEGAKDSLDPFIYEMKYKNLLEQNEIIAYKNQSLEQDLQILNERLYTPIEENLTLAIENVAKKHKVTYILEANSLLYFDKETALDLTDEVEAEMLRLESLPTAP